jgi:SEC-C motif-containing protein
MNNQMCPCGSGLAFDACCGPLLAGDSLATSPVALMRSRYTAYSLQDAAYLLKTWHPDHRPAVLDFTGDTTEWRGLTIIHTETNGAAGIVEFSAVYRQSGTLQQLHERSRFIQQAGAWLYQDGILFPTTKPGRNDPCPCGSGKKYKKCCGGG